MGSGPRFSLDAGYQKLHLDTVSHCLFAGGILNQGFNSLYFSNLHTAYFGIRFAYKERAELYAGLTRVQDTGDGRNIAAGSGIGSPRGVFQVVQAFPLTFQSPMARLSIRITPKLRWNAGWQFFNYDEKFQLFVASQGYRANTGLKHLIVCNW